MCRIVGVDFTLRRCGPLAPQEVAEADHVNRDTIERRRNATFIAVIELQLGDPKEKLDFEGFAPYLSDISAHGQGKRRRADLDEVFRKELLSSQLKLFATVRMENLYGLLCNVQIPGQPEVEIVRGAGVPMHVHGVAACQEAADPHVVDTRQEGSS